MDLKSQVEKSAREHKTEKFKQEVMEHKARNKILQELCQDPKRVKKDIF